MSIPYWRLSGFYFFHYATWGSFAPYWSIYLKYNGFSSTEIGSLSALLVGTKIVAPNLWGFIADRTGKNLRLIRIALFFTTLLFACFLLAHSYYWFAWITISFSFLWNATTQFEAITFFHLKSQTHQYSQIRLWGSLGFIIAVLALGSVLDSQPITLLPIIIIIGLTSTWCMSLLTPEADLSHAKIVSVSIKEILIKPEVLAFFIVSILLQVAHSPYYTFYSIYLTANNYSTFLIGTLWALGVIAEIILFIYAGQLLKRYSLRIILLVSIFLSIIRWLLIAHWTQLGVLIIAQILHAATFGGSHIASTHLVRYYFEGTHHGKGRALYISVSLGLGSMLGNLYSGYYWESLGAEFVFSVGAFFCSLALLIAYRLVDIHPEN